MKSLRDAWREAWQAQRPVQTPVSPYDFRSFQGVESHPKLASLLAEGWEIVGSDPVMIAGTSLRQRVWRLRRPNPKYSRPSNVTVDLGSKAS